MQKMKVNDSKSQGLVVLRRCLFLVSIPLFFVTFALPIQSKALGASALEIGGLFSLFTFSILLMRPVIGVGIDRLGRRVFFLFATVFYVGAYAGYALADGIEAMYAARFFQGIGASLLLITVDTMTADLVSAPDRGEAMGKNIEVQTRASIVGATMGFTLIGVLPLLGWKVSFGLFTLFAVFALFFALLKLPESLPVLEQDSDRSFTLTKTLRNLLLIFMLLGAANALIMPIYMIFLQDEFTSDTIMLSWAFLPAAVVAMVLPSKLGRYADKGNPQFLMSISLLIAALLYFWMPFAGGFWLMVMVYTLSNIVWSLIGPLRKSLTANSVGSESTARAFGLSEMAFGAGATAGPLMGGYLYDNINHAAPFIFVGVLMLVTAVISFFFFRDWNNTVGAF